MVREANPRKRGGQQEEKDVGTRPASADGGEVTAGVARTSCERTAMPGLSTPPEPALSGADYRPSTSARNLPV